MYVKKLGFIINPEDDGMQEGPEKDGKVKNAFSFRGTGFKT
jgi:hypothetical protein